MVGQSGSLSDMRINLLSKNDRFVRHFFTLQNIQKIRYGIQLLPHQSSMGTAIKSSFPGENISQIVRGYMMNSVSGFTLRGSLIGLLIVRTALLQMGKLTRYFSQLIHFLANQDFLRTTQSVRKDSGGILSYGRQRRRGKLCLYFL